MTAARYAPRARTSGAMILVYQPVSGQICSTRVFGRMPKKSRVSFACRYRSRARSAGVRWLPARMTSRALAVVSRPLVATQLTMSAAAASRHARATIGAKIFVGRMEAILCAARRSQRGERRAAHPGHVTALRAGRRALPGKRRPGCYYASDYGFLTDVGRRSFALPCDDPPGCQAGLPRIACGGGIFDITI